jgi:hypothetical protein
LPEADTPTAALTARIDVATPSQLPGSNVAGEIYPRLAQRQFDFRKSLLLSRLGRGVAIS